MRFLLWRLLGLIALLVAITLAVWLLRGGLGSALRGTTNHGTEHLSIAATADALGAEVRVFWSWAPFGGLRLTRLLAALALLFAWLLVCIRWRARRRRRYVRMRLQAYRTDSASAEALVAMFETLHKRVLRRWWRRLLGGQPSVSLEVHYAGGAVWMALTCPAGTEEMMQAAVRTAYPNCRLVPERRLLCPPPAVLRLKKHAEFIKRAKALDRFEHERGPAMNRLITAMGACSSQAFVQVTMTPTPALFERHSKRLYKRHETHLSHERRVRLDDRSMVEDSELRGGLDLQHRPLFFADLRVVAPDREQCEQIASELRAAQAENRLIERGTSIRHGVFGVYGRRVLRGEGNPLPCWHAGVFAATELASIWHLPSVDYATVPFARCALPVAPAPTAIWRPTEGAGTLRDALGAVSIHPAMRKQNTAVPGTVEQGKSSYLVATVAEDLRRERCAVIVFDPKGDAAEAAVSLVPAERTCTLLDLAHPTCGFNPLAVDAPADVIADYVVAALKQLFSDADIRASSDRYLRNAIIAVLAYDRESTLWDAARLLSVGEEGYSYRNRVGARLRTMPEFKEISQFFTAELTAQLADSRSMTTAKLDAPVNKLARLLNSPSIKRVLLNDSLRIDFDRVIVRREILVVKGALGAMGAGNTSVLMQLLAGMLDAALARQQDLVPEAQRVTVALKVDEAPLVLNGSFAETMALKRSAGLETVACWQTEAQWTEREVRDKLDALFAHRVYFATASAHDARAAVELTMAEFSDTVRPGIAHLSALGRPDARLHLPRHHAIVSWSTPEGRQSPFIAETIPLRADPQRVALHLERQAERGGRYLSDLRQPHWDRQHPDAKRGGREHRSARGATREREFGDRAQTGDQPSRPGDVAEAGSPHRPAPYPAPDAGLGRGRPDAMPALVPVAADSYRELVELDGAFRARWAKPPSAFRALTPEPIDLEVLTLVASLCHVLTSQIHRRFNPGRAVTTTQRRLKRLSDAGWLKRFQFHRRDGGGAPMCYAITPAGLELLHVHGRLTAIQAGDLGVSHSPHAQQPFVLGEWLLRQARHDVHVAGWVLALERSLKKAPLRLRGVHESALSPPPCSAAGQKSALGPEDLTLPGGRVPHDFLRTTPAGERVQAERFETVRPDATIELPRQAVAPEHGMQRTQSGVAAELEAITDLLVELDDRLPTGAAAGKLERYDHFIAGWSAHTARYGRRLGVPPAVVFICRDRSRARECARRADAVLTACRAYAGEYPADWEYPGRDRILFVAERDVHEECLYGYGVPRLPPQVRMSVAHGDPRAQAPVAESREIPCWPSASK